MSDTIAYSISSHHSAKPRSDLWTTLWELPQEVGRWWHQPRGTHNSCDRQRRVASHCRRRRAPARWNPQPTPRRKGAGPCGVPECPKHATVRVPEHFAPAATVNPSSIAVSHHRPAIGEAAQRCHLPGNVAVGNHPRSFPSKGLRCVARTPCRTALPLPACDAASFPRASRLFRMPSVEWSDGVSPDLRFASEDYWSDPLRPIP